MECVCFSWIVNGADSLLVRDQFSVEQTLRPASGGHKCLVGLD